MSEKILSSLEKETLSFLGACLASAQGNLTVDQLQNDYLQLVGSAVPLKKLNHKSLVSFLESFPNEFAVRRRNGNHYVYSLSTETKHIEKLVQTQKSSTKARRRPPPRMMRRPQDSSWVPPRSYTSYGGSQYQPALSNKRSFGTVKPSIRRPINFNNQYDQRRLPNLPRQPLLPTPQQQNLPINGDGANLNKKVFSSSTKRETNNRSDSPLYKPLLEYSSSLNRNPVKLLDGVDTLSTSHIESQRYQNSSLPISDRTKGARTKGSSTSCNPSWGKVGSSSNLTISTQKDFGEKSHTTFKQKLKELAKRHQLDVSYETILFGQKKKYFISEVRLGIHKFKSYPEEIKIFEEAEEYVSEKAYKTLKLTLKDLSPQMLLPQTVDDNLITDRLKQLLCSETEGLWWDSLLKKYENTFQESLSTDYIKIIEKNNEDIAVIKPLKNQDQWILSHKPKVKSSSVLFSEPIERDFDHSVPAVNGLDNDPPSLQFPDDKMWNVFISYIKGCNEIWFRIIGEDYSDEFENLVTDMELQYMEKNNLRSVASPVIGSYYACNHEESWFRVQLTEIKIDEAEVFFVDHGDSEVVALNNLFELEDQFLKLPCQSLCCNLVGMEYDFQDQNLLSTLQNLTLGKSLVAEVQLKDDNISVILFDTSTDDDVNINEKLFELLPNSFPEPVLPSEGGICEVYVSHVSADGDVFVRLETASFKVLEALLVTARQHTTAMLGENSIEIDLSKLYLAKFSADGEWHRAAPRTSQQHINGEVIACKLHNVPSTSGAQWTESATDRLISLTKDGPQLLKVIKGATESELAQVQLFQRIKPQNYLVSINDTLDLEPKFFSNEDRNNNHQTVDDCSHDSLGMENTLPSAATFSDEALDKQELLSPVLPPEKSYFDLYVTYAASPSNFAVQALKNRGKLNMLMGEMQSFYSTDSNRKTVKEIYQGGYYALLHTDESWYRVHVLQVSPGQISGFFVDFGDFFCAAPEDFQTLCPNFRHLPIQSYKAELGGVIPVMGDWSPIDCIRFSKLVQDKELVSQVMGIKHMEGRGCSESPSYQKELPTLVLRLIDTSDDKIDVFIDEVLIKEERASASM